MVSYVRDLGDAIMVFSIRHISVVQK